MAGCELPVTATQCQPAGMLLPLGMTELVIHHMANADTVAGVTRALLLASGYADTDFQVLAETLCGARLPLHLQATHGNSTVVRAIRMEDPTHGLCPLVHDIHRGDHTGPITVTATFSGDRDIPMQPLRRTPSHPRPPPPPPPPPPATATTTPPTQTTTAVSFSRADGPPTVAAAATSACGPDDHPMPDQGCTDTASDTSDPPPPPAQRRRTDDPMELVPADTEAGKPAQATDVAIAPMDTDIVTLDGSARASGQVAKYAAVHTAVRAPTAASTLGRTGPRPAGLGFTGATTRARSHHWTPFGDWVRSLTVAEVSGLVPCGTNPPHPMQVVASAICPPWFVYLSR